VSNLTAKRAVQAALDGKELEFQVDGEWHLADVRGMPLIHLIAINETLNWRVRETVDFYVFDGNIKLTQMASADDHPNVRRFGRAYKLQINPDTLEIKLNEIPS